MLWWARCISWPTACLRRAVLRAGIIIWEMMTGAQPYKDLVEGGCGRRGHASCARVQRAASQDNWLGPALARPVSPTCHAHASEAAVTGTFTALLFACVASCPSSGTAHIPPAGRLPSEGTPLLPPL